MPGARSVKIDLMRQDRGYLLGRYTALVAHISGAIDPVATEVQMRELPEIAFRRLGITYRTAVDRLRTNEPERADLVGRRALAIVRTLRPQDMTEPLALSEQLAFSQGFFGESAVLQTAGTL